MKKKKPTEKLTEKELKAWSNQKVTITCTMHEAGNLMDLLFMADSTPFDNAFKETIKLNKMEKAYSHWLNKMVNIVCAEELGELKNVRKKSKHK